MTRNYPSFVSTWVATLFIATLFIATPSVLLVGFAAGNCWADQPDADHPATEQSAENWIELFNGKDLKDWTPKFTTRPLGENYRDTFRVEDGVLKIDYQNWDRFEGEFGHLFYKTPYSNYRLRVEYRFTGDQIDGGPEWAIRNNGLMIHGQTAESMKLDQRFPDCIEVQLLGGTGTEQRGTLNVVTPGSDVIIDGKRNKQHVIQSNGPTYHGDDWVTVEVEVHNNRMLKHIADGKIVAQYSEPQLDDGTPMTGGTISIQAETHPTEFRKIELLPLGN
ncbi:hypothetical protein LF1_26350 [Rubripirellula obstinata]|uniref:3-keto-alpha-glucoside-1,2-lyase/3-keto-2-hydroxy-glucal hydratase domain-containing protein n=1 Tax=Rubripirellula obstinata TaxID=406547 RepID=A0A5B1CHR1_9BACT|nr:DUF1080 domain-containing protein [Rubripirellula obstinata]KAA1260096.1 hypothetical protein LF1_26350 [Rubripirellula obstinata]